MNFHKVGTPSRSRNRTFQYPKKPLLVSHFSHYCLRGNSFPDFSH